MPNFINQALVNIVQGVEEANKTTKRFSLSSNIHQSHGSGQEVEFDVSVTVSQDSQGSVDGKIGVAFASLKGDIKQAEMNQNTHRIRFKIFVTENEFEKSKKYIV